MKGPYDRKLSYGFYTLVLQRYVIMVREFCLRSEHRSHNMHRFPST
jgi:hypothetical protein